MEDDMGDDSLPPRDPARLARVRNALMLPIMLGLGAAFLAGHLAAGTPGAVLFTVLCGIAAIYGALAVLNSSAVDSYARNLNGAGQGWANAALASAELVGTIIADE
jgi:hypothetical protein